MGDTTIPAEFVKIRPITDLPTVQDPLEGKILYYDNQGELKTSDLGVFRDIIQTGIVGEATPASSPTAYNPTDYPDGLYEKYDVKTAGTYANFKDSTNTAIVVSSGDLTNNFVQIWVENGVSQKVLSAKPQSEKKIDTWVAGSYVVGNQVINPNDQSIYEANANTTAADVPGSSSKWSKKVPGAELKGSSFFNFDTAKTTTTSSNFSILLGVPFAADAIITKVRLRNGSPKSIQIIIADKNTVDNTFTLSQSFPVTTVTGVNEYDEFIRVKKGQFIGVSGVIAMGTDSIIKNVPYIKFTSAISSTPIAAQATLSDAQIAISYDTIDIYNEIERLKSKLPVKIGNGTLLAKNTNTSSTATPNPLFIADPWGFNQPLHPTVMYFASGFNGYKYVMIQTPFPRSTVPVYKDRFECPMIHYSNDGINWTAGILIDDLTQAEIDNHDYFSDPDLILNPNTGELEVWYRITRADSEANTDILRRIINADGSFGARQTMMSAAQLASTTHKMVRSHALIFEDGKYKMWFTGWSGGNVGYGETTDPTNFANWTWQQVSLGTGATNSWHLDVVKVGSTYYLFNDTVNFDLQLYSSSNGINFTKVKDLLTKTNNPKDFYGAVIYRSSGLVVDGLYSVYVSGWNSSVGNTGIASIGLMRGTSFENLSLIDGGYNRQDLRIGGNIRLSNLKYMKSIIELDDRGNALGFDYDSQTLYFQRANGEKISIAK